MPERLIKKTDTPEAPAKVPEIKDREQLFELIKANEKIHLSAAKKVFEHSIEDGLLLADCLGFDGQFLAAFIALVDFKIKHREVWRELIKIIEKEVKSKDGITKSSKQWIFDPKDLIDKEIREKNTDDWEQVSEYIKHQHREEMSEFVPESPEEAERYELENEITKKIDAYYAPLLRTRKFKTVDTAPSDYPKGEVKAGRRPGETRELNSVEELADEALEQEQLLRLPAYYARQTEAILNRYLKEHGHDLEGSRSSFTSDYFVTEETIKDECEQLNIPFEEIKPRLKAARYFSITASIKRTEAKKGLVKKLNEGLAASGQKVKLVGDKYEVVDVDDEQKIEKKEDTEEEEEFDFAKFEEKTLDYIEKLLKEGADKRWVAEGLAGLDSNHAWKIRQKLLDDGVNKGCIARGLAGLDSPQAWAMRREFIDVAADEDSATLPGLIAQGLAGLDSDRAWAMRRELLDARANKGWVAMGLAGLDSDRAWAMRRELLDAETNEGLVAMGLAGLDSERAWQMRQELLATGTSEGYIAESLAGLDSERAWQMRRELLDAGTNERLVALGLAGLDSDRAWAMRQELLAAGADKDYIAQGLAGLDSDLAWTMRQELLAAGADKSSVARGLVGYNITFVWQLKLKEKQKEKKAVKKEQRQENKEFDFAKFEEKSLDYIDRLLEAGVNKDYVAQGLAGLYSDRAWQMRDQLLNQGADKDLVASGLAGLDSDRAWQMRDQLLNQGVSKGWVARGLAGLDSDRAWKMRDQLLDQGASKDLVASGLAGLYSDRAWQMRDQLLDQGVDKDWVASGLAGLDSDRAWKMRDQLLDQGADKGWVARGLAGLNSERAWDMREQLLEQGASKGYVASGLAGDYTTFVWQLKLKEKQKEDKESKETTQDEQKQLDLINLLHRPTLEGIFEHFGGIVGVRLEKEAKAEAKKRLPGSSAFINTINKLIGKKPELFLGTMPAKRDRLPEAFARRLAEKIFPEVSRNQKKSAWHGFPGYSGFEAGKASGSPDPADYLKPGFESEFGGGGAEGVSDNREIMEFREAMNGIVVSGIFGQYSASEKKWKKADFIVDAPVSEPALETTATIPNIKNLTEVALPKPLEARIIPERVKGFDAAGREYDLEIKTEITGETRVIKKPKAVEKIVYSLSVSQAPAPMEDLSPKDYSRYRQQFEAASGRKLTEELGMLPEDLELQLLEAIKDKTPKQQVAAIERLVRDLGYYDTNNQEVNQLKRGKSLEEQVYIMEQRVEELRQKQPELAEKLAGKRFAGVCADFAQLSAMLLRRAGFASGMISGFGGQSKKISVKNAHATAFVVWPDAEGHNRIISIDGTPDGVSEVSLPSLLEKEAEVAGQDKELSQIALKEIQKIIEGLNKLDVETVRQMSNGELERVLNGVLKYQVKESHLAIIERLFDYYWYTPIHQLDLANPYQRSEAILQLAGAVERQRKRLAQQPEGEETPAGNKLMQTMQDFLGRFAVAGMTEDKDEALTMMEKIVELVQNDLSEVEKKAAFATIAYLKAKNILGDKK